MNGPHSPHWDSRELLEILKGKIVSNYKYPEIVSNYQEPEIVSKYRGPVCEWPSFSTLGFKRVALNIKGAK